MQILYSSLHNLDMSQETPVRKEIPVDFNSYMEAYVGFATKENKLSREYEPIDSNRTVLSCISSVYKEYLNHDGSSLDTEKLKEMSDSIALKLLNVEKLVQERIGHMTNVQKGSIIQALLKDEQGYRFVVAKVEHSEWYDGETLEKNLGFPGENKRVWKSAVTDLECLENEVQFTSIKVYVNHQAKYWTADFLELQEKKTNAFNTKTVLHAVEKTLKPLKEVALQDYYTLRNTVVHELQSEQIINYPDMIGRLLDTYEPENASTNVSDIKEKLLEALMKYGFDAQFQTDPSSIKKAGRIKITVTPSIDVLVREGIPNWKDEFYAYKDSEGRTYLMIRCNEQETLKSFPEYVD